LPNGEKYNVNEQSPEDRKNAKDILKKVS